MPPALLLFCAGAIGGALNSVAGGGSFVVFPAILFSGISPVSANATTTVGLWPASLASVLAYRREIPRDKKILLALGTASLIGGAIGALLLLKTSDATFTKLIPWLIGFAAALFTFGPRIQKKILARFEKTEKTSRKHDRAILLLAIGTLVQLVIATYGGYFGGGMGILMLATFSVMGMTNIHAMNALKNILGALLNGVALVCFLYVGQAKLAPALATAIGGIAGGYVGATIARKIPQNRVRSAVVAFAWVMTAYFVYRAYVYAS